MIENSKEVAIIASLFFFLLTSQLDADDEGRDWGFDCNIPVEVFLNEPGDYPYVNYKSTCGMIDDYSSTCLGSYDGGEDVIYRIEATYEGAYTYRFILDPMGSTRTGMVLSTECPDAGISFEDCLAYSVNEGSDPYFFEVLLTGPATYYLMIDTWPSPDCIPQYGLQIKNMDSQCNSAPAIYMPAEAPYADLDQTTCGLNNFYHETCMGEYDNGEEKIYKIVVEENAEYRFKFDPKGTTFAGISIAGQSRCPPTNCIGFYSNMTGDKIQFDLILEPDTYFLMIDTWPSPDCIPDYDLTIDLVQPPPVCGDATGDGSVNFSDAVFIINYVFISGPAPDPVQTGDVNCDEAVNISDAVWIIKYVFVEGKAPCDIDGNGLPDC